jgi:plasmid stabilization system protein ParE
VRYSLTVPALQDVEEIVRYLIENAGVATAIREDQLFARLRRSLRLRRSDTLGGTCASAGRCFTRSNRMWWHFVAGAINR